uniref:PLD phosphodiesterase domain-containing protein n=1 Tax=Caenorhabditis japonica TaxID=281687 RepID=A0A8R1E0C7_CAEJA
MDYFPLFIYRNPRVHFPTIDDAIRRAVVRGVKVRLLAAALHYPAIGTRFLRSLESLNGFHDNGTMQVKIFKVPKSNIENIIINRERRTHNKFMVTESSGIIGTSNWSGDYFMGGTTGAAIVIKQDGEKRPFVDELKEIFTRDWESDYAHRLDEYFEKCVTNTIADFCEVQKDPKLFADSKSHL